MLPRRRGTRAGVGGSATAPVLRGNLATVNTWFDYRMVWSTHPWVLAYAIVVLAVLALAVVGTFLGGPLAILFIPSLAGVFIHHLMVTKRRERQTD